MAAFSVAGLHEYCFPHSENGLLDYYPFNKKFEIIFFIIDLFFPIDIPFTLEYVF